MGRSKDMAFLISSNDLADQWPRLKEYVECLGFNTGGITHKLLGFCSKKKNTLVVLACYGKSRECRMALHGNNDPSSMANIIGRSTLPTDFQLEVARHMKGAPEDLAEYVRERVGDTPSTLAWRILYRIPINAANFNWHTSPETAEFWRMVSNKSWDLVVRDFWKRGRKEWPLAKEILGEASAESDPAGGETSVQPELSEQHFTANDIDFAYLTGVFNASGIDGLHKEIQRLRELNTTPSQMISKLKSGNNA